MNLCGKRSLKCLLCIRENLWRLWCFIDMFRHPSRRPPLCDHVSWCFQFSVRRLISKPSGYWIVDMVLDIIFHNTNHLPLQEKPMFRTFANWPVNSHPDPTSVTTSADNSSIQTRQGTSPLVAFKLSWGVGKSVRSLGSSWYAWWLANPHIAHASLDWHLQNSPWYRSWLLTLLKWVAMNIQCPILYRGSACCGVQPELYLGPRCLLTVIYVSVESSYYFF